jgi:hypothetical protein
MNNVMRRLRRCGWLAAAALAPLSAGPLFVVAGQAEDQISFATPQAGLSALIDAAERDDTAALLRIFGPKGKDIVQSGDDREDKEKRAQFAQSARQKSRLIADPADAEKMIVAIGEEEWQLPVPLVRRDGSWRFMAAQGRQEILARRIGFNELTAIEVCHGYVEAQYAFAQAHRPKGVPEYARKIVSAQGQQDGLFWEPAAGAPECDVPKAFAKAAASMGDSEKEPYFGYYFKELEGQGPSAHGGAMDYVVGGAMIGGFALVAWPAKYGVSGVQTFIVDHDGIVYEKHLGPETSKIVEKMKRFDPDKSWQPIKPQ